jgi:MFS family permease
MLPVVLLKSKKFTSGFAVYTLSYLSMTGALFYVTLLFQNADGWSVLRTGLSWLCMNIPFLIMAQFGGRLQKRYSHAAVVIAGCVAAALGAAGLSLLTTSTPFAVFAVSFALMGAGYAMAIPAITSMAMSDAPPGTSGAASGILNSSRQIGASVGLAVMGTVGINSAVSDWTAKIARLPASARAEAARQAQNVAGANVAAVTRALGSGYRHQAIASFVHGYQLALVVGAACLLAAAVLTAIVFVRPARPRRRPDETLNRPDGSRTALRRTGRITTHRA